MFKVRQVDHSHTRRRSHFTYVPAMTFCFDRKAMSAFLLCHNMLITILRNMLEKEIIALRKRMFNKVVQIA